MIIRLRAVVWLPAGVRVLHGGLVLHGETWGRASLGGLGSEADAAVSMIRSMIRGWRGAMGAAGVLRRQLVIWLQAGMF